MAEKEFLVFKCLNPDCMKPVKLKRPEKSGAYKITCPHCGVTKPLKLKGLDEMAPEGKGPEAPKPSVPDNSGKAPIEIPDDFLVGEECVFLCPHCKAQEIGFTTEKPGLRSLACPKCRGPVKFEVRKKTERIVITEQIQTFRGKLLLLRRGWINKEYKLPEGHHIVGRYDEDQPSDISVKNDDSVSRRSVSIDVALTGKGYTFKLTVLKATNPVLHNNTPLLPGESVSLNFGDSIQLGKTKFRFEKDKK